MVFRNVPKVKMFFFVLIFIAFTAQSSSDFFWVANILFNNETFSPLSKVLSKIKLIQLILKVFMLLNIVLNYLIPLDII